MDESSKNLQKTARPVAEDLGNLPDQRLMQAQKAMRWLEEAGFQARLAGGCVRDRLLGIRPKDYDIASDALPEQVSLIFKQKGAKVVPTGIDHGTVTVVLGGQGIEITSLRKDVSTDGRRALVSFGSSFEEDAERRDFTMNALYEDLAGQVYDYFDGQADMKRGVLRFVGSPEQRIREDYLRILRLFRFWARFGFRPETQTLDAVKREVGGLKQISQERCTSEILALLSEEDIDEVLQAMQQTQVFTETLEFREPIDLGKLSAHKSIRKTERALTRLAALLLDKRQAAEIPGYLEQLRLSKKQMLQILSLITPPAIERSSEHDVAKQMDILDQLEKVWGLDGILLAALPALKLMHPGRASLWEYLQRTEERSGPRRRSPLPINGQDLIERLGISSGPKLGTIVLYLKESFRRGEWSEPEEGFKLANKFLQSP